MVHTSGRAVIFDMDGVILDTEPISMRAWMAAAAETGYALSERHCHEMIGLGLAESKAYIEAHVPGEGDLDRLVETANANYLSFFEHGSATCKAGLWDLLSFLKSRRIPAAIATSTRTHLARKKLRQSLVLPHFEIVVGGDDVIRGKPAPDIYLLAADRLGQSPADCIVLEDSGPGIAAAASAGMRPIFIPDICRVDPAIEKLAYAKVATLFDVISILQRDL